MKSQQGRETFASRLGFVLAASGAAVGLGNIWGFPTQVASNGGGAFLLMYILLIAFVAFPMLVVELAIGRSGQANPVDSIKSLTENKPLKRIASIVGWAGISVPCFVLAFYSIVGGWILCYFLSSLTDLIAWNEATMWLEGFSVSRNLFGTLLFYVLTIIIVQGGVQKGIEKWSVRLMPMLFILFGVLFVYVMTQTGAVTGLKHYLIPDFSKIWDKDLLLAAMGQGFFSLTIGGCSMLIYGSYLSKKESLVKMAVSVAAIDTSVAFLAGLVIIPAMFVAMAQGVSIYDDAGQLLNSDTLVFQVLPLLFENLGILGKLGAVIFFLLLSIAALTSSISMLQCPVALIEERRDTRSAWHSWIIGLVIALLSTVIIFNFGALFGFVIKLSTQYLQPIVALCICLFGGWVWNRNKKLQELSSGDELVLGTWFGRIWPLYVRWICPLFVTSIVWASLV